MFFLIGALFTTAEDLSGMPQTSFPPISSVTFNVFAR